MVSLCSRNHTRSCWKIVKYKTQGSVLKHNIENSLAIQWLGLHTSTARGTSSILGTEIRSHMPCSTAKTHTPPPQKKTQKSNKNQNTIWPVSETYTNDNQQLKKKKKKEIKKVRKSHKKYPQQEIQCESHKTKSSFTRKPELSAGSELRWSKKRGNWRSFEKRTIDKRTH